MMLTATKKRKRRYLVYQEIERGDALEEQEQAELFTADIPEYIKEKGVGLENVLNRKGTP